MNDPTQWKPWLVSDQRFVSDRPDVATWKSAPLDKPVHIMGAPQVDLFAATSGTDSDWVVKLIDVYPERHSRARVAGRKARDGGLRDADRHRDLSRALPEELRCAGAAQVGSRGTLSLGAAQRRPRVPAGSPDHGADPVEPVPALRSQSADATWKTSCTPSRATIAKRRRAFGSAAAARAPWSCQWCAERCYKATARFPSPYSAIRSPSGWWSRIRNASACVISISGTRKVGMK